MSKKPKILFIFPPVSSPVSPYLSTPLLAGQLKAFGYDVTCLDLSLEFFDYVLSKDFLLTSYKKAKKMLPSLTLDVMGKTVDSPKLASIIENSSLNYDQITFVIGGSYGLSEMIKDKANLRLSFSPMTFPHQLFRVMLLEQIYRASTISNNILYHK